MSFNSICQNVIREQFYKSWGLFKEACTSWWVERSKTSYFWTFRWVNAANYYLSDNVFYCNEIIFSHECQINEKSKSISEKSNFCIQSYAFEALAENLRQPRVVKVGAIQNSIAVSTTAPVSTQRDAIFKKIGKIIDAAGEDGVNVLCLQEAWSTLKQTLITSDH